MRKYLYFWVNKYRRLDDFDESKGYLFEDLGLNLSSEYNISHTYNDDKELSIKIEDNTEYIKDFYTSTICDIKTFVGNNGAGKTSLLRLISDIISKRDLHEHECEYVLVYVDQEKQKNGRLKKKFYYYKNTFEKESCIKNLKFPEKEVCPFYCKDVSFVPETYRNYPDDYSAKLTIFYSPSFSGNAHLYRRFYGDGGNYKDISTDALLLNDKEAFSNPKTYAFRSYGKENQLFYYSALEQNRLISFLLNAGEEFFKILPIPQMIKMTPSLQSVDLALSDLAVKIVNENDVYDLIINELQGRIKDEWYNDYVEKFNEKTRNYEDLSKFSSDYEYDKDELVNSVKKCWMDYYQSIKSLNDMFRFAALMSYTRTFYTNSHVKEVDSSIDKYFNLNLRLKYFLTLQGGLKYADFWNKNHEIIRVKKHIENIIRYYDKCSSGYEENSDGFATHKNGYYQNGYIVFNLNEHHDNLKKIHDEYNDIYKLTDFVIFGFTRPLSSGEDQFLRFYSRLYWILKDVSIDKPIDSIHLFIDEGELYLHPEWQRKWLDVFIRLMQHIETIMRKQYDYNNRLEENISYHKSIMNESRPLQIQLFMATHSPFMLTDMFENNIIRLKRKGIGRTPIVVSSEKFVAGDINGILKNGFFMKGTLGAYIEKKIIKILKHLKRGNVNGKELKFVNAIGNPIMRAILRQRIQKG